MKPLFMLAFLLTGAALAQPVSYTLDPDHSFVHFEVLHFGTSTTRGRVGPFSGSITLDRQAGSGTLDLSVATASVDTGLGFFDSRIRQPDLLASEAFPEARFVATRWRFDGELLAEVAGDFTLRGVSQPLTLRALRFGCRRTPGGEVCGGDFDGALYRSAYGMVYGWPFIANRVALRVQVEGKRNTP
jgi:polyisoprenoid-binding protein YceI